MLKINTQNSAQIASAMDQRKGKACSSSFPSLYRKPHLKTGFGVAEFLWHKLPQSLRPTFHSNASYAFQSGLTQIFFLFLDVSELFFEGKFLYIHSQNSLKTSGLIRRSNRSSRFISCFTKWELFSHCSGVCEIFKTEARKKLTGEKSTIFSTHKDNTFREWGSLKFALNFQNHKEKVREVYAIFTQIWFKDKN